MEARSRREREEEETTPLEMIWPGNKIKERRRRNFEATCKTIRRAYLRRRNRTMPATILSMSGPFLGRCPHDPAKVK